MNFHCNQHNVKANSAIYEKDNHDRNLAQSQTVLLSLIPIEMAIYFDHVCSSNLSLHFKIGSCQSFRVDTKVCSDTSPCC